MKRFLKESAVILFSFNIMALFLILVLFLFIHSLHNIVSYQQVSILVLIIVNSGCLPGITIGYFLYCKTK